VRKSDLLAELTDVLSDGVSQDLWLLSVIVSYCKQKTICIQTFQNNFTRQKVQKKKVFAPIFFNYYNVLRPRSGWIGNNDIIMTIVITGLMTDKAGKITK